MKASKLARLESAFEKLANGEITDVVVEYTTSNENGEVLKHSHCVEHLIGNIADGVVLSRSVKNTATNESKHVGRLIDLEIAKYALGHAYDIHKGARLKTF